MLKLNKYIKFFRSKTNILVYGVIFENYFIQQLPRNIKASRFGINIAPKIDEIFDYKLNFWKSEEKLFLVMMTFFQKNFPTSMVLNQFFYFNIKKKL